MAACSDQDTSAPGVGPDTVPTARANLGVLLAQAGLDVGEDLLLPVVRGACASPGRSGLPI